jgi:hypothetical protein
LEIKYFKAQIHLLEQCKLLKRQYLTHFEIVCILDKNNFMPKEIPYIINKLTQIKRINPAFAEIKLFTEKIKMYHIKW